jgi:hypothetical protein
LLVGGLSTTPSRAWLLADARKSPLKFQRLNSQDVSIMAPAAVPDAADSVIALQFDEEPRGGGIRLLSDATGAVNQLLVFDALAGDGAHFGYGDGKANRYYVTGWTDTRQSLQWEFRLNAPARFNVALNYGKGSGTGHYELRCGEWKVSRPVSLEAKPDRSFMESLGVIDLPAGTHRIELHAMDI